MSNEVFVLILSCIFILPMTLLIGYLVKAAAGREDKRFQEFAKALKARDLMEYTDCLPEEGEDTLVKEEDEIEELEDMDEKVLVDILRR